MNEFVFKELTKLLKKEEELEIKFDTLVEKDLEILDPKMVKVTNKLMSVNRKIYELLKKEVADRKFIHEFED